MSDEIKWNKDKHDHVITEREKANEENRIAKLRSQVNYLFKDHMKRVKFAVEKGQIKTAKEVADTIEQLRINIQNLIGKEPALEDWWKATELMLEDAAKRAASGLLSQRPAKDVGSVPRRKKRISPSSRRTRKSRR